jgi:hypothetical protein
MYGQNNPEKLGDVDTLLTKDGEEKLLMMVRKKYGIVGGAPASPASGGESLLSARQ